MQRILLKLSGEALAGPRKTGFDEETVRKVALQVKALAEDGMQIGIVIGGGNFWRGRTSENIDRTKADQIGMLATVMNCIYVSEIFRSVGLETSILTPSSAVPSRSSSPRTGRSGTLPRGRWCSSQGDGTSLFLHGHRRGAAGHRGGGGCDPAGEIHRRRV